MIISTEEMNMYERAVYLIRLLKIYYDAGFNPHDIKADIFIIENGYSESLYPMDLCMYLIEDLFPNTKRVEPYTLYLNYQPKTINSEVFDELSNYVNRLDFEDISELDFPVNATAEQLHDFVMNTFESHQFLYVEGNTSDLSFKDSYTDKYNSYYLINGKNKDCFGLLIDSNYYYDYDVDSFLRQIIEIKKTMEA